MSLGYGNPGALAGATGAEFEAAKLQGEQYSATPVEASGVKPTFATGFGQSDTHALTLSSYAGIWVMA
jgi:phage-related protein